MSRHGGLAPAPVIVFGAHRSGTSLVTRALEALGVFMGRGQDPNGEPLFFVRRNEWLLRQAGGAWDRPWDAVQRLADAAEQRRAVEILRVGVAGSSFRSYLGWRRWLLSRLTGRGPAPWGWKDPRNTWTVGLWTRLFPDARLICVERNGVDATQSLLARESRAEFVPPSQTDPESLLRDKVVPMAFLTSQHAWSFERAFTLWEASVAAGREVLERHRGPTMTVRYEDLVAAPDDGLARLAAFCGVRSDPVAAAADLAVDRERRFVFLADPAAMERYRSVRDRPSMQVLGYGDLAL